MSRPKNGFLRIQLRSSPQHGPKPMTRPIASSSNTRMANNTSTPEWRVYNHPRNVGYLGTVMETNERLARCAALAKFGVVEGDEFVEVREGVDGPIGIMVGDDFDVRIV